MEGKKKKKKVHWWLIILIIILLMFLSVAVAGYMIFKSYHDKSNYVKDEDIPIINSLPDTAEDGETPEETLDPEAASSLAAQIEGDVGQFDVPSSDAVYNVLLIGSDRRDTSWYGNSDSMILASVNENTKTIHLTSFMRDLYAVIPGFGAQKLNAAYAHGAGPLLVQTIEENFKIDIDNYASVDFNSMATIIDMIGGINLDIYQEEADYLNKSLGTSFSAGNVHMNGDEAVAYSRIRYVGKYDYERTSRQRRVLEQIFLQAQSMSLTELNNFINAVLPYITHNLSETDLLAKITKAPEWIQYELVMDRVPYDDLYTNMGEQLVPDYPATIERLHNNIYGTP